MTRQWIMKIALVLCALMQLVCSDNVGTGKSGLSLTVEDVSCTEVWLQISTRNSIHSRIVLTRDTVTLDTLILTTNEMTFVDDNLLPSHRYTYTARFMDGAMSSSVEIRTLDTTSHAISWSVDTLGDLGVIRDVWIFDRNDAIAVGEIYLRDSGGQIDMSQCYNAAKWNGKTWELMRVPFTGSCSAVMYPTIRAIYAFSENNIWFARGGSLVHYDGTNYYNDCSINSLLTGSINKLWGSSSSDLYAVGNNGLIAHYDGRSWSKQESGTNVDLNDIYGLDGSHVWAVGTEGDYSRSVILYYDGKSWNKLYEGSYYGFNSIWTERQTRIYITGDSGPYQLTVNDLVFHQLNTPARYVMYCVRGTGECDIFYTGQNSEITHFNGMTYHLYEDVQGMTEKNVWWQCIKVMNNSMIAGGSYYTGLYSAPVILRGYR